MKDAIQKAAEAHTNMTVFGAVVSILEGGHLYGNSPHRSAERIIEICKREQRRQCEAYDAAVSSMKGGAR